MIKRGTVRTGSLFTNTGELGVVHPCRRHVIAILHAVTALTCLRPCRKSRGPGECPWGCDFRQNPGDRVRVAGSERAGRPQASP